MGRGGARNSRESARDAVLLLAAAAACLGVMSLSGVPCMSVMPRGVPLVPRRVGESSRGDLFGI